MKHPHKLPSFCRILFNFIIYVSICGAILYVGGFGLEGISQAVRAKINQIGIIIVYVAGLLAGLSFYWSSKARQNILISAERINSLNEQIVLLNKINKQLRIDHVDQFSSQLASRVNEEKNIYEEAKNYPETLEKAGLISLIFLAIGSVLQILGQA